MTKVKPLFFFFKKLKVKSLICILFLVFLIVIPFLNVSKVNAITSSVTSGLKVVTGTADTNQQNFINVGGYDILIVGYYIMFYDINGNLAKTYDLTTTYSSWTSVSEFSNPRIAVYNSTHIVIANIGTSYPTSNFVVSSMILLNVNTLSTYVYNMPYNSNLAVETNIAAENIGTPINLAVYVVDNNIFVVGVGSYANYNGMGVWEMNSTYAVTKNASIAFSQSSTIPLGGCWLIIPSTDSNSFYLIAETAYLSHLFLIDEINYATGTITLIGVDGIAGGYSGGYVYLLKSQYLTADTGSVYYEVLIYYPDHVAPQQICLNLIRFNNTFVDVHHKITIGGFSGTFEAPYIRLLGYDYISTGSGIDGIYNLYYVGLNYLFKQLPISLTGTNTNTITWSLVSGIKASDYPQWQTETYNFQTGNLGGFWNINTGIMVELDYSSTTNSLCVATKFLSVAQGGSTGVGSGNNGGDGSGEGGGWGDSTVTPTPTPTPISGTVDTIIPIITSIFGNVTTDIIFIIYGVVCGLLTWKFALTGLIAGIGISTFLCVMAGILNIWAVGLCIILDITLIVLGSGLLNKTGNENKTVG